MVCYRDSVGANAVWLVALVTAGRACFRRHAIERRSPRNQNVIVLA